MVTSAAATLATGLPPSITTEPASLSVFSGTAATFYLASIDKSYAGRQLSISLFD